MKRLRPPQWSLFTTRQSQRISPFLSPPNTRPLLSLSKSKDTAIESIEQDYSDATAISVPTQRIGDFKPSPFTPSQQALERYPSPPSQRALTSAKLAALHSRLNLPSSFSIHTLARCLVDATADGNKHFNNASLALLGADLAAYYVAEHIICHYPRIPMDVLFVAQKAYIGSESMTLVRQEWGVDPVVAPGGEVDPGLLQFARKMNNQPTYEPGYHAQRRQAEHDAMDPDLVKKAREKSQATSSARVMRHDVFGDPISPPTKDEKGNVITTLEDASRNFVNAVIGALALHGNKAAAKSFISSHILSRKLDISRLFSYAYPLRDIDLLCRREGFEEPIARLISETGRKSAHPVFVVGIFSGRDKLGEGVGGSLKEAKTRAAVASLKGWYLYSPLEVTVPSEVEKREDKKAWRPNLVDQGEVFG